MATTPSEATAAAACFACIPDNMRLPVIIYILNETSGPMATPAELVADAVCYACIPQNMQMPVVIRLLTEGGLGGGAPVIVGSPEGVVTASPGAFRWDSAANTLYFKATGTGNTGWIVLLGV
jgi:hypothetical protein